MRAMLPPPTVDWDNPVRVFDPFAGNGRKLAELQDGYLLSGMDIDDWTGREPFVTLGDSTNTGYFPAVFDVVFTSPTYGNRLADVLRHDRTADTVLRTRRGWGTIRRRGLARR